MLKQRESFRTLNAVDVISLKFSASTLCCQVPLSKIRLQSSTDSFDLDKRPNAVGEGEVSSAKQLLLPLNTSCVKLTDGLGAGGSKQLEPLQAICARNLVASLESLSVGV